MNYNPQMNAEASIGKVLSEFALALPERATGWIRRRKPRLHVHFEQSLPVASNPNLQRSGTAAGRVQAKRTRGHASSGSFRVAEILLQLAQQVGG
jgi:hypothetical protein